MFSFVSVPLLILRLAGHRLYRLRASSDSAEPEQDEPDSSDVCSGRLHDIRHDSACFLQHGAGQKHSRPAIAAKEDVDARGRPMRAAKKAAKSHSYTFSDDELDEEDEDDLPKNKSKAAIRGNNTDGRPATSSGVFPTPGNVNVQHVQAVRHDGDEFPHPRIVFAWAQFALAIFDLYLLLRYQFTTSMANVAAQAVVVGKCQNIIEFHNIHNRAYNRLFQSQQVGHALATDLVPNVLINRLSGLPKPNRIHLLRSNFSNARFDPPPEFLSKPIDYIFCLTAAVFI